MRRLPPVLLVVLLGITAVALAQERGGRLRETLRARAAAPPVVNLRAGEAIDAPGDYRVELMHDGLSREYRMHVPRGYRRGHPMPLLVALHGGGGDMDWQADDSKYGLISASERRGFIAVFPNGFSRLPGGRLATWNAGRCCGPARDRDVDDVGFIRAMVADVSRTLHVDRGRVYATGMSNGGMMAYRLACEAPDVFRAIAAVAGTDNTSRCEPAPAVSVLHIHALDDDHVLFDGGAGAGAFRNPAAVTDFASVPVTVEAWTHRNGCRAPPRRIVDVPGAHCDLYAPCAQGSKVQLCVTDGGGHSWPGGSKARGAPSQAIDANDTMWAFFDSLRGAP